MSHRQVPPARSVPRFATALGASILLALAGTCWAPAPLARAQQPSPPDTAGPSLPMARPDVPHFSTPGPRNEELRDKLLLLRRVEGLAAQGRVDEAIKLLEDERAKGPLDELLERRLINLYSDAGLNAQLEELLRERIRRAGKAPEIRDLRMLGDAQLAQGKTQDGVKTFQRLLDTAPTEPAVVELVAKALSSHGENQRALQTLLDARKRLKQPDEFAQLIGTLQVTLGRPQDATREFLTVIAGTPANLSLLRGQLMELADDRTQLAGMIKLTEAAVAKHPQVLQLQLLLAELRQRSGDETAAWAALQPALADRSMAPDLLQLCLAALGDSHLEGLDPQASLASLRLSQRILQAMVDAPGVSRALQPRLYDALNRILLAILEAPSFGKLPAAKQEAALEQARAVLAKMAQRSPDNPMTNAALLRLAQFYVTTLHRPQEAIALYRRLTVNPNAGREDVQLARVGLGTAYIAAGDTAEARALFTAMGKDMAFVSGQGRAHYYLGMLDFMGGHFKTAQDRFAAVALEAASADYTNDALDLALILAEEQMGQTVGRAFGAAASGDSSAPKLPALAAYGRSLYYTAVAQDDSAEARLREVTREGSTNLRGRAYLDLGRMLAHDGHPSAALAELDSGLTREPRARTVPAALELKGDLLKETGDLSGAAAAYESILADHEDYVFLENVRDKARALVPNVGQGAAAPPFPRKGELP